MPKLLCCGMICLVLSAATSADSGGLRLPAIFSDGMVLQQQRENPLWGWAGEGTEIAVTFDGERLEAVAAADGRWQVMLPARDAGGPWRLEISAGGEDVVIDDILFGEVWFCSGQSNMAWTVNRSKDADLEVLMADYPSIRLHVVAANLDESYPDSVPGEWRVATGGGIRTVSAVAYQFAMTIHRVLGVPVGIIQSAVGGTPVEAWINRPEMDPDPEFTDVLSYWNRLDAAGIEGIEKARPGILYSGMVHPFVGYGIRGFLWYQGESNASVPLEYRYSFPFLIESWRSVWGDASAPFYWVQIANWGEPALIENDGWPLVREAQTMALEIPHTGQAVTVDVGNGIDVHPENKADVGRRLARLALADIYGQRRLVSRSPMYAGHEVDEDRVRIRFDNVGGGLIRRDLRELVGFAIAGDDRIFTAADALIVAADTIEVSAAAVPDPVAVRYAWARNPPVNVFSREGLPLTPFRTDDWMDFSIAGECRAENPEISLPTRSADSIVLDGRLDDAFWQGVPSYSFQAPNADGSSANGTRFMVARAEDALYFGIRCDESNMDEMVVLTTVDEDALNLFRGDVIELLLETPQHSYYQIAINPAGAVTGVDRQRQGLNFRWIPGVDVATHQDKDSWSVEVRIPFAEASNEDRSGIVGTAPTADQPWYFNLARARHAGATVEQSVYAPIERGRGLHDKNNFVRLVAD